jgi:hypothetical protein
MVGCGSGGDATGYCLAPFQGVASQISGAALICGVQARLP